MNLSQECKGGLILENSTNVIHHIDKLKEKSHIIILKDSYNQLKKI